MTRFDSGPARYSLLLVLLAATLLSSCGAGRRLESVTLSPGTADAQSFPNGQVPFAASGTYSRPPSPVPLTSNDVVWCVGANGVCAGNIVPGATVDQTGLAQCVPAFVGTVTILAGKASSNMVVPDGGQTLKVFGSAQLTCP
jgi:hypothetical protein